MTEIPKHYDFKSAEKKWYKHWLDGGYFHADATDNGKTPYTIVIPPPNVTDILHIGHALNNSLQDIMIRYRRMAGFETEWLPGVDHAGIATQVVVEKQLVKEKTTRQEIGREKFVERVWKWKEEKFDAIIDQLKLIGCSCDWDRTRFTMDEGLSDAVKEVFIRLFNEKLIYKGHYITNWCPKDLTSLSDDEVEYQDQHSHLWYIKYKIAGADQFLTVATTRPETMLGDAALAVSPKDQRYQKYVGQTAILPILDREIPIIADDYVDPEFGTGVVKVTPAHDPNDFQIGLRHDLPQINVMNPDASLNENAGKFKGMDRYEGRKALLKELEKKGHLEKTEKYDLSVGVCYRCGTVLEPYLSKQWYVRMKPLAEPAIEAVKSGKLRFHPEHWEKTYLYWLENVRDWCISRQLWWGHRIPIFYCQDCDHVWVAKDTPRECPECKSKDVEQDPDVLDTWFSSWLWPFSTFGWPEETPDLKRFYPTNSLFTASEIIYLWVARMVMAGYKFLGDIPFTDVYIHGTVRDSQGRKMSKSLGNGIDPRDIIKEHGADALRISLVLSTPEGQDPCISFNTFEQGRNFANKLWNASRFVMMNLGDNISPEYFADIKQNGNLALMDEWILSRLNQTIKAVRTNLDTFRFNAGAKVLYDFIWHDFCDWYVELVKSRLRDDANADDKEAARNVVSFVLNKILLLLNPYMPFVTEEIWQGLHSSDGEAKGHTIIVAEYPKHDNKWIDPQLESGMESIQSVVNAIRAVRAEMNVPPSKRADVHVRVASEELAEALKTHSTYITELGRINDFHVGSDTKRPNLSASAVIKDAEVFIPLEGLIDIDRERSRLKKDLDQVRDQLFKIGRKLGNPEFLSKAAPDVVEREKRKRDDFESMADKINNNLEQLMGW
ncbi:MAG: valine--tRNA ligase [candidate division Zixibacteria bacterium]|nr:valine--tRNA ligase [candidate division Zixibacteria bacterium]MBU1469448.1 valine--tRNA ligase [candidate division Zixibacteria bacterium]MBU2624202.1 valine--tRNA ligase [candidate division Zixibacteria bacterium]